MNEIEKKYLVKELPNLELYRYNDIEQAYLSNSPTVRIRKIYDRLVTEYILTYKSTNYSEDILRASVASNKELEFPLTEDQYDELTADIRSGFIIKRRHLIPLEDGLVAELDIFEGALSRLIIVEVEFSSLEAAANFNPPSWFGKDVSLDKRYSNSNLSRVISIDSLLQ